MFKKLNTCILFLSLLALASCASFDTDSTFWGNLFSYGTTDTSDGKDISDDTENTYKTVTFIGCDSILIKSDTLFAGSMNEGETSMMKFVIRNNSGRAINITGINSGCGCTTVQWKKSPIEPDESRMVTLFYNSSGQFGKQIKTIRVTTDSKEERMIYLVADVLY